MKTLLIVRHAKSSWDSADISDIDRPLNDRGKRDAPAMAQRLIKAGVHIDRFVSSPARRARNTAEHFAQTYGRKEKEIRQIPKLPSGNVIVDGNKLLQQLGVIRYNENRDEEEPEKPEKKP